MNSNFLKDFRCPQYVNFIDGMDSNSESPFFDCNEYQTPQNKNPDKSSPVPERGLAEEDENKLMNKMTAALSFLESTPKLKKNILKEKLFTAKAPLNTIKLTEIRPLAKVAPVQKLPSRIRSKTVARLDKILTGKVKAKDFKPKRSSSLSDLRTVKKHTFPRTPLCLKRTIDAKAKAKALKTTEEMELEQITELQKQLSKMLRQNEIAYRKLHSKQRPIPPKNHETVKAETSKPENSKAETSKPENSKAETSKPENSKPGTSKGTTDMNANKNSRQGFKSMGPTAIKKVLKLDSIINGGSSQEALSKALTTASYSTKCLERSKIASVSSSILSEEGEKTLHPKKSANPGLHSGVFFCDNNKKSTVPKPFAFETRMKLKKSQSTVNDENSQISSSDSVLSHDISSCKENFSVMKAKSEIKTQNVMNVKSLSSKKAMGGSNRNTVRGFPLSENRNRN